MGELNGYLSSHIVTVQNQQQWRLTYCLLQSKQEFLSFFHNNIMCHDSCTRNVLQLENLEDQSIQTETHL